MKYAQNRLHNKPITVSIWKAMKTPPIRCITVYPLYLLGFHFHGFSPHLSFLEGNDFLVSFL
ncbi:hypothetical protein OIU84_002039 [Salix udensis]|uniref:Uncharacterized protein n=1 Tax=Salix udensis TaxID=889485 RepID=A0AAD6K8B8_9ROSI|nr:hypothetical protein OIU84_002039 [Salix udensis]